MTSEQRIVIRIGGDRADRRSSCCPALLEAVVIHRVVSHAISFLFGLGGLRVDCFVCETV
jgi:hypothetical protein